MCRFVAQCCGPNPNCLAERAVASVGTAFGGDGWKREKLASRRDSGALRGYLLTIKVYVLRLLGRSARGAACRTRTVSRSGRSRLRARHSEEMVESGRSWPEDATAALFGDIY
ncbi:hypothetical protein NDU88_011013 [Pleurodeles waltl]|uniref:Uncharacterized protein n=1 Tax=Pleurodeles waltl TaxID=8319 RepID=A0AAV7Q3V2_PLEWA|nr:hypothetical protein NDU88_011013 [Pleurodeles waltl]